MPAVSPSQIYSAQLLPCLSGQHQPDCGADKKIKAAINLIVVAAVLYFVATLGILLWKLRSFRSLPYAQVQVAVVFYRLQVSHSVVLHHSLHHFVLHPRTRLAVVHNTHAKCLVRSADVKHLCQPCHAWMLVH